MMILIHLLMINQLNKRLQNLKSKLKNKNQNQLLNQLLFLMSKSTNKDLILMDFGKRLKNKLFLMD